VRIVVLAKPVPDATGEERLGPDGRLDRSTGPGVVNGNDEYALEAALRLVEAHGGEVTLLAMAGPWATEALRKGLALGAARAVLVSDDALAGSCALTTMKVLAAALRTIDHDLVMAGADSSDGGGGVVAAGVATLLGLPYLSYAADVAVDDGRVRVRRLTAAGHDVLEASLPAVVAGTQLLGAPRYPTLKGIMAARSREIAVRSLGDLGLADAGLGGAAATSALTSARPPAPRGAARLVRESPQAAAAAVVDFLAERRAI
jgi:electron transfer flavoprotein beta subunit